MKAVVSFPEGMLSYNTEKFWDRLSFTFDKRSRHFEQTYQRTIELTKKCLHASDTVLDYGCATGIFSFEIADNVKEIQGIDISQKMIEAAQRKAGERKTVNIGVLPATIFDERFTKESFNIILAFNVLHFLKDTPQVMQRIHELLRPGGFLFPQQPAWEKRL